MFGASSSEKMVSLSMKGDSYPAVMFHSWQRDLGPTGAFRVLTEEHLEAGGGVPLGRNGGTESGQEIQQILGGGLQSTDNSLCLGDIQADVNFQVVENRSTSDLPSFFSSPPRARRKLFTRCPAVQPRAVPRRLFSITQIKKHSIPASHTTLHTLRGETVAQRGTWFALSFP